MKSTRYSLRQLEHLIAVADAGTINAAASELHVSQPGLSQSLTELERALDTQLLVRRRAHGVTLTPSGIQVLRHARELLRSAEELEEVASGGTQLSGTLSLGCYVTLAPTALPAVLHEFSEAHPDLTVDFGEDTQDVLQRRLVNGEIDLAILYDMELNSDVSHAVIDTMRPHILLPVTHPLAGRDRVSLAELADEPQVLLDSPPSSHNTLAIFQRFGITPHVRYRPKTFELARALVGHGLGYALLVQRPSNDRTYAGHQVVVKEIVEPVGEARVVVAWAPGIRLTRRAEAFLDFCDSRRRTGHTLHA